MEEDATGRYSSYDRNILIRESQQTFILVKTSWRRISFSSLLDVFKTLQDLIFFLEKKFSISESIAVFSTIALPREISDRSNFLEYKI